MVSPLAHLPRMCSSSPLQDRTLVPKANWVNDEPFILVFAPPHLASPWPLRPGLLFSPVQTLRSNYRSALLCPNKENPSTSLLVCGFQDQINLGLNLARPVVAFGMFVNLQPLFSQLKAVMTIFLSEDALQIGSSICECCPFFCPGFSPGMLPLPFWISLPAVLYLVVIVISFVTSQV